VALIDAWLIDANTPIRGTHQAEKELRNRVIRAWLHLIHNEKDVWARTVLEELGVDALCQRGEKMVAPVMDL